MFRLVVALLVVTVGYNALEGVASIAAGFKADSIVLITFGADSYLEVGAAGAVLWRLSYRNDEQGERAETKALRFIGATFLVLALAVVFQSANSLIRHQSAEPSSFGVAVLIASLVLMPALALAKLWAASRSNLPALAAEAKETIACVYLSLTAVVGLLFTALLGWWWIDAGAALLMVPWLVKEGLEGVRGDSCFEGSRPCFCRTCLFGLSECQVTCCNPVCC